MLSASEFSWKQAFIYLQIISGCFHSTMAEVSSGATILLTMIKYLPSGPVGQNITSDIE